MADGVRKTYIKEYRSNLKKAMEILLGEIESSNIDNIFISLQVDHNLLPAMSKDGKYISKEKEYLKEIIADENIIGKIQRFAKKNAYKDTERKTHQAMEAFIHNLNTMHSRAGAQIPFSSINYGTDTSEEGRMVIRNLFKATERGLGNGETPIFPIQIFKVKEGINYNEDDPNYDLFKEACKVSAKRLFPNFSFIDAPFNLEYYKKDDPKTEVAYMGCRSAIRCA